MAVRYVGGLTFGQANPQGRFVKYRPPDEASSTVIKVCASGAGKPTAGCVSNLEEGDIIVKQVKWKA